MSRPKSSLAQRLTSQQAQRARGIHAGASSLLNQAIYLHNRGEEVLPHYMLLLLEKKIDLVERALLRANLRLYKLKSAAAPKEGG